MSFCLFAGMVYGQPAALKVGSTGFVGLNTSTPTVRLDIPNHNTSDNIAEIGSYGIASLNSSNGFLTHNVYFDLAGTANHVRMRAAGKGAIAQFFDGRIIYRTVPSGDADEERPFAEAFTVQNNGDMQIGYPWTNDRPEKLEVNGNVAANGVVLASDKRLKKNISKFDKGLKEVMALNPINYQYNGKAGIEDESMHVGLIAQELQKIAPELVINFQHIEGQQVNLMTGEVKKSGTAKDYLRINDTGVKYMLVNAIKEQQGMLEDLRKSNEELRELVNELAETIAVSKESKIDASLTGKEDIALLKQNAPNPFNGETEVKYFIPASAKAANIMITTNNGQVVKTIGITEKGEGVLSLTTSDIPVGNYHYTLSVDGKVIDTKTMSLVR